MITLMQSSKAKNGHQVKGNVGKTKIPQVEQIKLHTHTHKQKGTGSSHGKEQEGIIRARYGNVVQKPHRLKM